MTESRPFAVGIAGGSGSGKSALIRALLPLLGADRVATLSHEAYDCDRGELPAIQRAALGGDVPEAVDTELFLEHLEMLRACRPVRPPRYCFSTHRRIGVDAPVEPRPLLLVEGVLLLHDPRVRALVDLTIFLDVPMPRGCPAAARATSARPVARDARDWPCTTRSRAGPTPGTSSRRRHSPISCS